MNFENLNLSKYLCDQLKAVGVNSPTEIQKNCIPKILDGIDCIGCAKTGSGKTLAFALPILQKLWEEPYGIFALILTPTRELAYQIADQFAVIGKPKNLRHCVVTGGMEMIVQARELSNKPHIVVSTPGRLADHLESCDTFSLKRIQFLVLDEADRLLGGKFDKQIATIFKALPKERQTLLFSATMTDTLEKVKMITKKNTFVYESTAEVKTVDELEQFYVLCPYNVKDGYLVEIVRQFREKDEKGLIMIFTDTCKNCQLLHMTLNEVGFDTVSLHAMISQRQRLAGLAKFKSHVSKILIATDVASRGLDIPAVSLVINHIIPNNATDYVHRVGRTARAGRQGRAVSIVTQHDIKLVKAIEAKINIRLKEYDVSGLHVAKILTQVHVTKREAQIKLDETDFDERRLINKRKKLINEGKDPDKVEQEIKRKRKEKKRQRFERRNLNNKNCDGNNVNSEQDVDNHINNVEKSE
ncbi:probable ATP-dependent RNA helicase DDX49 [Acyrthosiphon pisum]|uniref:RNA helicase n=1 Tax=Acyrthosiphon pisum TaxID=7029 RepID=A0A8R1W4Y3_ACYPI|nr:probable ATP-dependent RNA helicase DDX49 [Acyrthosiphon pisum]|eukprot:XP_001950474.2 PREDICTED: probable ATP-dependent RNA helicase DDX49 [Acyrthosiphon pisum]